MIGIWQAIGEPTVGKVGATAAAIGVCIFIEDLFPYGDRLTFKDRINGAILSMAQASLWFLILTPLQQLYAWLGLEAVVIIPLHAWAQPLGVCGPIASVIILLLITDFLHYWWHRADHAWFWPIHAAHHSTRKLQAANNYGHPAQVITGFLFMGIPLSLIQLDGPEVPYVVITILGLAEFLIHSPTSFHLGSLRCVFVDNRFHRIHHSIEQQHQNKNFGIVFTIWDRIFGTAHFPAKDEWPDVGVEDLQEPHGVTELLLYPSRLISVHISTRPSFRASRRA